jgi:hypothetical protein
METIYNVEYDEKTVFVTIGDPIDISLSCTKNGVADDLTGKRIDMDIKDFTGAIERSLSTTGGTPSIVISTTTFNIGSIPFTIGGIYTSKVILTDGTDIESFMKVIFIVEN